MLHYGHGQVMEKNNNHLENCLVLLYPFFLYLFAGRGVSETGCLSDCFHLTWWILSRFFFFGYCVLREFLSSRGLGQKYDSFLIQIILITTGECILNVDMIDLKLKMSLKQVR